MKNITSIPKKCECGAEFIPASNRQIRCPDCIIKKRKKDQKQYHRRTYQKKGYNQKRENNNAWKGGVAWYRTIVKEVGYCERCGSKINLLVHHKDHDRSNNDRSNLEVLCKRCHQKEHVKRDKHGRFTSLHSKKV